MRTELDGSTTPATISGNLFSSEYLALMCEDEPVPAAEEVSSESDSDPWHLEPHPLEPGWAVLPQGTSLFTTQPHASSQSIDFARLAAAVLPSTEQPSRYRLGRKQDALGYPVFAGEQVVGHFQFFDKKLLAAINVVAAVVAAPGDLAWLLHAAGGPALDLAGKFALERTLPPF